MASRRAPKKQVEPSPLSPYLGPLLLRAREAAGMKQDVVAKKAGTSDTTLRKIEHGKIPVEIPRFESICKALGVNSDVILLEASTAMRCDLLEKLGRDPELPLHDLHERRRAALKARHEAELKQLEAQLDCESLSYLKQKKFMNRE
jgi:transcriptional regulator with XRE-family HTH domain